MTITVTNIQAGPFPSTGVPQTIPFNFKSFTDEEVEVYGVVDGEETIFNPSSYTVTLNENPDGSRAEGGSVTISAAFGQSLYVRAAPLRTQPQVWSNQGSRLVNMNEALDRAVLSILRLRYDLDRGIDISQETLAEAVEAANEAAVQRNGAETAKFAAEASAEQVAQTYADILAIQASGDQAAAIGARAAKAANLSDLADPLEGRANIEARPQDGFVSVTDYHLSGDGDDYGPALGRALAASPRVIWADRPGGYEISSLVSHTITADTVIDWNNVLITFTGSGRVNLKSPVVVGSGRTLASNAARWATTLVLNSGASIQRGDILNIQSSILPSTDLSDNKQDTIRVAAVASATVTLEDGVNFAWNTADAGLNVTVWRPAGTVTHRAANFYLDETDGAGVTRICVYHEAISGYLVDGARIRGPLPFTREVNIYRNGFVFYYSLNGLLRGLDSEAMSYPVLVAGGSRYLREENTTGRYNHHTATDMGGWGSDYELIGLEDQDSFVALSTHACFRAKAARCSVRNNTQITAWRCCGGAITDSYLHSTDNTGNTVQMQYFAPASGYEYIYTDRGDFTLSRVKFDNPNRTVADIYIRYGARVVIEEVEAIDIRIGATVVTPVIKLPLRLRNGKAGPERGLIESATAQVPAPDVLDAYLDSSVYHIDLYRSVVPQSGRTLRCRGQIGRKLAAGGYNIRLHYSGFVGLTPIFIVGFIKIRAFVQHQSSGFYSWIEHKYPLGVNAGGGSFIDMNTTPVGVVGPRSGSSGADITLALSSPAIPFNGTDGYISFTLTVGTSAGVTAPNYQLEYELELTETNAAA